MTLALAMATPALAAPPAGIKAVFCNRLGNSIQASAGAQMFCFGAQGSGTAPHVQQPLAPATASPFTTNVNAASLGEDISPAGARAYGQSETSIAAAGPYVVEAWNDSTGFFSACPSPQYKEELTGYGFSSDGGASFTDMGGVPNSNCSARILSGDPSVEAWRSGGHTYFYISSLYPSVSSRPQNDIAVNACEVTGSGASARLACHQPTVAAASTQCGSFFGFFACGFLDKEYLSIDPARGRLYVTYTEFGPTPSSSSFNGEIELAVCDIGTPGGAPGPAGGTAAAPKCEHGTPATKATPNTLPYLTLGPGDPNCQNEGAYPGVNLSNGDVYAAYEFNQATNIFNPACFSTPTREVLTRVPASCLVLHSTSFCAGPSQTTSQPITSLDGAFIPGYNRFPANDFPRIAVDPSAGVVGMVWNDARLHPLGDILLRSFALGTLRPVQRAPVVLNRDTGGLHFLPALRNATASGLLDVTWYDRADADSAITAVRGALGIDPRLTATPAANPLVTSAPTDWNSVSSDIVPNFGDYTDNYIAGGRLYVAWSDGRLGVPQPFAASAAAP